MRLKSRDFDPIRIRWTVINLAERYGMKTTARNNQAIQLAKRARRKRRKLELKALVLKKAEPYIHDCNLLKNALRIASQDIVRLNTQITQLKRGK